MATALNKTSDVHKYTADLAAAKHAYRQQFFSAETNSYGKTQTGNSLGLLVAYEEGAAEQLMGNLAQRDGK